MPTAACFMSARLVRSAAVACCTAASCLALSAQQPTPDPTSSLSASLKAPAGLFAAEATGTNFYSSSTDAVAEERASLADVDASQPPPRRRYSRPRYSDRMHNADGSSKISVALGAGLTLPMGNTGKYLTTSYSIEAGVGYNFNKKLGVLAEVGYDHFGMNSSTILAQQAYYSRLGIVDTTGAPVSFAGLDGNAHVWSVTLNPIYTFYQGDKLGSYVIGGGGYYHKAINFTTPQTAYAFSPYGYGAYPVVQNTNIDTHSANGGGFNVGGGVTYKPSRFSSAKIYAQARYVYVAAKLTPEPKNPSPISMLDNGSDSYVPITVGLRW